MEKGKPIELEDKFSHLSENLDFKWAAISSTGRGAVY